MHEEVQDSFELAKVAAQAAAQVKATDLVAIDVHQRLALTDVFLLITADNERQVRAIVGEVDQALHAGGVCARAKEGTGSLAWVLLDYGPLVVHVFTQEQRSFYDLERLWKDCPRVPLDLDQVPLGAEAKIPAASAVDEVS